MVYSAAACINAIKEMLHKMLLYTRGYEEVEFCIHCIFVFIFVYWQQHYCQNATITRSICQFALTLGAFLCILGFYYKNGFIWRGVEPGTPLNTPMLRVGLIPGAKSSSPSAAASLNLSSTQSILLCCLPHSLPILPSSSSFPTTPLRLHLHFALLHLVFPLFLSISPAAFFFRLSLCLFYSLQSKSIRSK